MRKIEIVCLIFYLVYNHKSFKIAVKSLYSMTVTLSKICHWSDFSDLDLEKLNNLSSFIIATYLICQLYVELQHKI